MWIAIGIIIAIVIIANQALTAVEWLHTTPEQVRQDQEFLLRA